MRVHISQVGKDRHVDRMLTLIVAPKQEPVPELDRREQPFERQEKHTSFESYNLCSLNNERSCTVLLCKACTVESQPRQSEPQLCLYVASWCSTDCY